MFLSPVKPGRVSFIDFDDTVSPGGDYVIYDLGSGPVSETVDQAVWYNVDILLTNGSTLSTSALIFQTPSGETFLNEFATSLDNLDIPSITPTPVNNAFFSRTSTSRSVNNTTVCFAKGTEILIPDGPRPPVRFETGTLGHNMPSKPLIATANHRMLCASRPTVRMFVSAEVFIPAKRFVGLPGMDSYITSAQLEFFHLQLETLSVICANGAFTESCLIGPVAVQGLPMILRSMFLGSPSGQGNAPLHPRSKVTQQGRQIRQTSRLTPEPHYVHVRQDQRLEMCLRPLRSLPYSVPVSNRSHRNRDVPLTNPDPKLTYPCVRYESSMTTFMLSENPLRRRRSSFR